MDASQNEEATVLNTEERESYLKELKDSKLSLEQMQAYFDNIRVSVNPHQ